VTHAAERSAKSPAAVPADQPLLCGGCGFDLRARTTDRCPECGRRFDPNHLITALIPWEQRKYIGRVRAYIWTVLLVTFQPWRVADKVAMPVSLRDATRFRRVTVSIAVASIVGFGLMLRSWAVEAFGKSPYWPDEWAKILISPWSFAVAAVGLYVGLSAASRLAVPFFRAGTCPRVRTIAVGQYASAPLAWVLPVAALSAVVLLFFHEPPGRERDPYELQFFASALLDVAPIPVIGGALVGAAWLWSTLALLKRGTGCSWRRVLAAAVTLPVGWVGLLVLTPLLLELLVAFFVVVVISLG
jgi:hypothetical protein